MNCWALIIGALFVGAFIGVGAMCIVSINRGPNTESTQDEKDEYLV